MSRTRIPIGGAYTKLSPTKEPRFQQQRGFRAEVELDAEPELPIAFVVTDVFTGTVLNFPKHVLRLARPTPVRG